MPTVCTHSGVQTQAWLLLSLSFAVWLVSQPFIKWSNAQDIIKKGMVREEGLCFLMQHGAIEVNTAGVSDTQGSLLKRSLWQLSEEHGWRPQANQVRRSAGSSFSGSGPGDGACRRLGRKLAEPVEEMMTRRQSAASSWVSHQVGIISP